MFKRLLAFFRKLILVEEKPKVYWFLNGYGRVELDGYQYMPTVGEIIFPTFRFGHLAPSMYRVTAIKPTIEVSKSGYLQYINSIKVAHIEVVLDPCKLQDGLIVNLSHAS